MSTHATPDSPASTGATTWAELFPSGRDIFYEGDRPDEFAAEIAAKHGFDPRTDKRWWEVIDGDEPFVTYQFHCPPHLLDAIYGNDQYPLGS
ncbi:hypothetical protein [Actinoplanes rectilineatus]|uniref:hypothetical protein n=1 Tax=Actinoplanes rectilineatus TaxID=113571 RepID=UPI0005F2B6BE|nr:hypothetical protein [Actinoplanes rectilineatus]